MIFLVLALIIAWLVGCFYVWRWAVEQDRIEQSTNVLFDELEDDFE